MVLAAMTETTTTASELLFGVDSKELKIGLLITLIQRVHFEETFHRMSMSIFPCMGINHESDIAPYINNEHQFVLHIVT